VREELELEEDVDRWVVGEGNMSSISHTSFQIDFGSPNSLRAAWGLTAAENCMALPRWS